MHIRIVMPKIRRPLARRRLDSRGDTIVEVLIAISIVSMVLGGAYGTTRRSLVDTHDAQERSTGVKLIESQIEQLRTLAQTNAGAIFGASVPASFCTTSTSGTLSVVTSSNSACAVGASGTPTSIEPIYHLSITQSSSTSGGLQYTTFSLRAWWYSATGSGKDNLLMSYRLSQ